MFFASTKRKHSCRSQDVYEMSFDSEEAPFCFATMRQHTESSQRVDTNTPLILGFHTAEAATLTLRRIPAVWAYFTPLNV